MASLIKASLPRSAGFTLLEMLVVIMLVSMLAGLLMQGFVYMSGVFAAVERRQKLSESQQLLEGWFKQSIWGVVNGIDSSVSTSGFDGQRYYFKGISYSPLMELEYQEGGDYSGLTTRSPHYIEWRLEKSERQLRLRYGQASLPGNQWRWYTLREWPFADADFQYLYNGQWYEQFPPQGSFGEAAPLLPQGIAISIRGLRIPFDLFVATKSASGAYFPPREYGGF